MNTTKSSRILSLILASMLLMPTFTSCGESQDPGKKTETSQSAEESEKAGDTSTGEESAPEEVTNARLNIPDTLPADLSYDGQTVTIYYSIVGFFKSLCKIIYVLQKHRTSLFNSRNQQWMRTPYQPYFSLKFINRIQ